MDIELRDYQQECVNIINSLDSGSYLVAVATGMREHHQQPGQRLLPCSRCHGLRQDRDLFSHQAQRAYADPLAP